MNDLTQQGIAALKAGNKAQAADLLRQVVQANPNDLLAWLWLSGAMEKEEERAECLRHVLQIDPNYGLARRALAELTAKPAPEPFFEPAIADDPAPDAGVTPPPSPQPVEPSKEPEETLDDLRSSFEIRDDPPPAVPAKRKKSGRGPGVWIALGVVACLAVATIFMSSYMFDQLAAAKAFDLAEIVRLSQTVTPSLTPVPSLTPIPSATTRPSPTPTPTETVVPLGASAQTQMERVQKQVSDVRGLIAQTSGPVYLITRDRAEKVLRSRLISPAVQAALLNQQSALVALGLIQPNYDLSINMLNHQIDPIGGVYIPASDEIFLLGMRLGAVEQSIYVHEFDQALVHQNNLSPLAEDCQTDAELCRAYQALTEGDAALTASQWGRKYPSQQDLRDILTYHPPSMALSEPFTPPYALEDLNFAPEKGLAFVKYLYNLGGWAKVNQAYTHPPASSEQILHPKKYSSAELVVPVAAPDLTTALGPGWQMVQNNVLGEWTTYLMLAFNVDSNAAIDQARAETAAAGWGGDRYQVYTNAEKKTTALAAHWAWDSEKDASEFGEALRQQLDARFRSGNLNHTGGQCWTLNSQVSCLYQQPLDTLWLLAPDIATLNSIASQYPEFK